MIIVHPDVIPVVHEIDKLLFRFHVCSPDLSFVDAKCTTEDVGIGMPAWHVFIEDSLEWFRDPGGGMDPVGDRIDRISWEHQT